MRIIVATLMLAAALPAAVAAQVRGQVPPARAQLERQVAQRFARQMQMDLGLTPQVRDRLEVLLLDKTARERGRDREANQLQQRLAAAVQDPNTSDAQFQQILEDIRQLRQREHEEWTREFAELRDSLTPRQQAQLTLGLARFQRRILEQIQNRPAQRGRGGGG